MKQTIHYPTIAAIATARGVAALAVVRVTGREAVSVVNGCLQGIDLATVASHTVHVGFFRGKDGQVIDQVVVTVFRAPRTVTGEDVVEVSCHGGDFAAPLILEQLLQAGARLAEPGEFTLRAFLHGKMDLTQAEAVADLIHASSSKAHKVALSHLQGRYSQVLNQLRDELLELCAFVELELDFSEEDVEFADRSRLKTLLDHAESLLAELLASYPVGEWLRDGIRVVIGGRPNAGKSTLLNALVGRDRAIVSPIPGTTRDEVEAEAEIEGFRFRFVDTAGLRETHDAIEAEGVRRAHRSIDQADFLLYLFDLSIGLEESEVQYLNRVTSSSSLPIVLVGNKRDLVNNMVLPDFVADLPFVALSAKRGQVQAVELSALVAQLTARVAAGLTDQAASPVVMNQRHRQHLQQALASVRAAREGLEGGISGDLFTLDLRRALHELGMITGAITNEDVLSQIFSRFCIGK